MGKRKYESISLIQELSSRNVSYNKRAKGLLKKSIELSVLCDQEIFLFVYDKHKQQMIHFQSHPDHDLNELLNLPLKREFLSRDNYIKVGGERQVWIPESIQEENTNKFLDWDGEKVTSQLGNLKT